MTSLNIELSLRSLLCVGPWECFTDEEATLALASLLPHDTTAICGPMV